MSEPHRIGLIGWGAVARGVSELVSAQFSDRMRIVAVLQRQVDAGSPPAAVTSIDELLSTRPTLVVEAAGQEVVQTAAPALLRQGISVVCTSIGALADETTRHEVERAAREGQARVIVPSGAVAALDLLRAARLHGLERVEVEQRKPPGVVLSAEEAAEVVEPRVVFTGSARAAALAYPRTMNIVAAVALAGAGLDRTVATLVADPGVNAAHVRVEAHGAFGDLSLSLAHHSSENPATSIITPWSVVAALDNELANGIVYR